MLKIGEYMNTICEAFRDGGWWPCNVLQHINSRFVVVTWISWEEADGAIMAGEDVQWETIEEHGLRSLSSATRPAVKPKIGSRGLVVIEGEEAFRQFVVCPPLQDDPDDELRLECGVRGERLSMMVNWRAPSDACIRWRAPGDHAWMRAGGTTSAPRLLKCKGAFDVLAAVPARLLDVQPHRVSYTHEDVYGWAKDPASVCSQLQSPWPVGDFLNLRNREGRPPPPKPSFARRDLQGGRRAGGATRGRRDRARAVVGAGGGHRARAARAEAVGGAAQRCRLLWKLWKELRPNADSHTPGAHASILDRHEIHTFQVYVVKYSIIIQTPPP